MNGAPGGGEVVMINVFEVEPHDQERLARILVQVWDEVMSSVPGAVSARAHLSLDGTRVTNYAVWRSAEHFYAMLEREDAREHMGRIGEIAVSNPHLYRVSSHQEV